MDAQKEQRTKKEEEESRIDYHIAATREAFNPKTVFAIRHSGEEIQEYHPVSEYTFSNRSGPVVGRYLWLFTKLVFLYLVKAFKWLVCLNRHD